MDLVKTTTINTQAPIAYNGGLFTSLISSVKHYLESRQAISELEAMSDSQLWDIGITRTGIKAAVKGDLYR